MIFRKKSTSDIYKNLKGFVNKKTIEKYITKNQHLTEKKYKFNPNKIITGLVLFCGFLFFYHLYTLWRRYQQDKRDNIPIKSEFNIVPRSGIYNQ
jgi:Leucine-rich repeat (LRR) protein